MVHRLAFYEGHAHEGLNLIAYLDDTSCYVMRATLIREDISENAVTSLRQAVDRFGVPVIILSDNGSWSVVAGRRKKSSGTWIPTLFDDELLTLNTELINSRPCHPQTNSKLEQLRRSIEDEVCCYRCLDDCVEYYNTDRLHWALDIDNYKTPSMTFRNKTATDHIKRQDSKWTKSDIMADAQNKARHDFHAIQFPNQP